MTLATATPTTNALIHLTKLESVEQEAEEKASELARGLATKARRLHGHLDSRGAISELEALHQRQPELFTDAGAAKDDTEAARLEAEIEQLANDLAECQPRLDQARRLAAKATQDRQAFVADNLVAVFEALVPEAEAVRLRANDASKAQAEAMGAYLGFVQRIQGLLASRPDLRGVRVPGHDQVADGLRAAENVDMPLPIPEVSHD